MDGLSELDSVQCRLVGGDVADATGLGANRGRHWTASDDERAGYGGCWRQSRAVFLFAYTDVKITMRAL